MNARRATLLALLLPAITVPWFFSRHTAAAVAGIPWWVVYSMLATMILALGLAWGAEVWWDQLGDEAEARGNDLPGRYSSDESTSEP